MTSTQPIRVAVSGAAGAIGYSLLFRIAAGDLFGPHTPVVLQLLEVDEALGRLEGTLMELQDCAFPLLHGLETSSDLNKAFSGVNHALLVGAQPRGPGMERGDLLEVNGRIFGPQGRALAAHAANDIKVTVTGNPANTNALIAMHAAPEIPAERFTALTRLDQNRAISQLAAKAGVLSSDIADVIVWGNHSATQYPDISHACISGRPAPEVIADDAWVRDVFIPTVAGRGAAIIKARGASSAASAASATVDHARDWELGTKSWVSMAVPSDGSYGVPEGLISSFPVTVTDGEWSIVQGLELDDFSKGRIAASVAELESERDMVKSLGLLNS